MMTNVESGKSIGFAKLRTVTGIAKLTCIKLQLDETEQHNRNYKAFFHTFTKLKMS